MGIEIDLNRLSFGAYRAYLAQGDEADDIALLCQVVVAWDLPGDPADPASYDALGMLDLLRVQKALRAEISALNDAAGN